MAVIEAWAESCSGRVNESERSYTVKYRVITNSRSDGAQEAASASIIPSRYSYYEFGADNDRGALRTSLDVSLTNIRDSMKDWTITATFSSRALTVHPDVFNIEDPVMLPPEVSGDFLLMQKPVERDKDGNSVINSANDYFEGLTDEDGLPTIVIAKNYNTISLPLLSDYVPSVNSTDFWGMGPRYWKLQKAPWQRLWKASGVPYYRITYEFQLNWETWDYKPADRGWYVFDSSTWQRERAVDKYGFQTSVQEWLNGNGDYLDLETDTFKYYDNVSTNASTGSILNSYRVKRERNFALLNVPMSL